MLSQQDFDVYTCPCEKYRVYKIRRSGQAGKKNKQRDDKPAKPQRDELVEILDLSVKVRRAQFWPFKEFDQQLTLSQDNRDDTRLFFNTSLEMMDFYDFLKSLRISLPGNPANMQVFRELDQFKVPEGWQQHYKVVTVLAEKPGRPGARGSGAVRRRDILLLQDERFGAGEGRQCAQASD